MLNSTVTRTEIGVADVWLDADSMSTDALWARVDEALRGGQRVWLGGALFEQAARRFGMSREGRLWLTLSARREPRTSWLRVRDVLAASAALVILFPLCALLALLVKRSSSGPVFYATEVVGKERTRFVWRKFRSMRVMRVEEDETMRREKFRAFAAGKQPGKVIDDARVTPIGKFIRKYSLDELPQLWNVLQGQMTLVGPRPCLPYEAELFPHWAQRRFHVKPGLTGLWQVCGRGRVTLEEGLAMDEYYTYARSFWLDLKLILLTLGVMVKGEGGR